MKHRYQKALNKRASYETPWQYSRHVNNQLLGVTQSTKRRGSKQPTQLDVGDTSVPARSRTAPEQRKPPSHTNKTATGFVQEQRLGHTKTITGVPVCRKRSSIDDTVDWEDSSSPSLLSSSSSGLPTANKTPRCLLPRTSPEKLPAPPDWHL